MFDRTHAIGDAARLIALEDAEVMVAGGAESAINRIGIAGFSACRALATAFNDRPKQGSRPYDKDRDGFVMGDGAGCVVLESLEHAQVRGAKIYAEIIGYGMSGDAYHITSPEGTGDGAFRAMQAALKRAGISPQDLDYVNAHGTSTQLGDEIELGAVHRLFGNERGSSALSMSSTKSAVGRLLGAAGAVEAIFSVLAIRDQIVPPTLNLDNPSVEKPRDRTSCRTRHVSAERLNSCCRIPSDSGAPTPVSSCVGHNRVFLWLSKVRCTRRSAPLFEFIDQRVVSLPEAQLFQGLLQSPMPLASCTSA